MKSDNSQLIKKRNKKQIAKAMLKKQNSKDVIMSTHENNEESENNYLNMVANLSFGRNDKYMNNR